MLRPKYLWDLAFQPRLTFFQNGLTVLHFKYQTCIRKWQGSKKKFCHLKICQRTFTFAHLPASVKGPVWVEEHDLFDDSKDDELLKKIENNTLSSFTKTSQIDEDHVCQQIVLSLVSKMCHRAWY